MRDDRAGRSYFRIVRGVLTRVAAPNEAVGTTCYQI